MAGHPLRSATDRRLGGPLPHQLANQTRVHLIPPEFFTQSHAASCAYAVLAVISNCYPPVWGRLPTRYSPVRRSVKSDSIRKLPLICFARLACVKHAASVHPEPGSNSLVIVCPVKINSSCLIFPVLLGFVLNSSRTQGRISFAFVLWIFRVCVLFNLQFSRFCAVVFLGDSLFSISRCFRFVNNFFQVFSNFFVFQLFWSWPTALSAARGL